MVSEIGLVSCESMLCSMPSGGFRPGLSGGVLQVLVSEPGLAGSLYCGLWRYCNCMVMDIKVMVILYYMGMYGCTDRYTLLIYIHAYRVEI